LYSQKIYAATLRRWCVNSGGEIILTRGKYTGSSGPRYAKISARRGLDIVA
jgi:hypothetical protein